MCKKMKELHIDIETYSSADLGKCGVYKYTESPDFEILLFGYSVDGGEVKVVDLAGGELLPDEIRTAMEDEEVIKVAHNASFERVCLSRFLGYPTGEYLNPEAWKCTMVWSAYMGLPLSLAGVGAVLGLDKQKMSEGKELIRYFCVPCAPTKTNGGRTRNLPSDAPEKWELFKKYNIRDVEVEMQIQQKLERFPVPDFVWEEYVIDQEINDRGVRIDGELVDEAIKMDAEIKEELKTRMQKLTALENPNSVAQLSGWLADNGVETDSLGKKQVKALIEDVPDGIKEVLRLRQQLAKSSVKKYQAMKKAVCSDGRARGMFMFYGANRTGRFCLTGDHEVLTEEGWKRLDGWKGGKIACWSPEEVFFGEAESVCFPYEGEMYNYTDAGIDQCSTPDHKMCVYMDGGWHPAEVKDITWIIPVIPAVKDKRIEKHEIKKKPIISYYKGTVYCAVTQTGYFLVRRNGKMWVTGNSGRLIQMQNLPQNHLPDLAEARTLVRQGNLEAVRMLYEDVPDTLSQLIRTAFIPREGARFYVADFSAIEARVLSWLAGEEWRMDIFASGGDIYCATASRMFGVPVVKHGENGELRQKGKQAELSCGYGGSVGALKAMGTLELGMKEEELKPLVDSWRAANPNIVRLWSGIENAAIHVIKTKEPQQVKCLRFSYQSGFLFITLPSGRKLAYVKPRLGENRFGGTSITYEGVGGTKKWERLESFGGKIVENIVQGISRDILCYAMRTLRSCSIVMHVHDELIIEADPKVSLDEVCRQMARTPPWTPGLVLRADGFTSDFYMKD